MKKRTIRLLALVMMLALVVGALAGCGGKTAKTADEELIVGKWETNLETENILEKTLMSDPDIAAMLEGVEMDLSGITMKMSIEFKKDGTYAMEVDKVSAETAMTQMMERLLPAMKEMLKKALAEGAGVDVSAITDEVLDETLQAMEIGSWEDLAKEMKEGLDEEAILGGNAVSGKYLLKDGKIFMTTSAEEDPAKVEKGEEYTVSDKSLTLIAPAELSEMLEKLTFNRVG